MMNNEKFAVFILTHGRPNNCITIKTLRDSGYTGKIVLVLDDTDKSFSEYKKNYSDCLIYVFSKDEAHKITDTADNTKNMKAVVYARNMCHQIASNLELESFLVLDDDYNRFEYLSGSDNIWKKKKIKSLDKVFDAFINFLKSTKTETIAFTQAGDYIGGYFEGRQGKKVTLIRKVMNSFFCLTERPFSFYGLINEDVNYYVLEGSRGKITFSSTQVSLIQTMTQQNAGGLTTIYLELGTYVKSFYTLLYHPSSVTIKEMGVTNKRLHHAVNRNLTFPKIISEKFKKLAKSK